MSDVKHPKKTYLKDYTPFHYSVESVKLDICVFEERTVVRACLAMTKRAVGDLWLFGRDLQLLELCLDGAPLSPSDYVLDDETLRITAPIDVGQSVVVQSVVEIAPKQNTSLEGLYWAGSGDDGMYVTQCEAEGFRKITFYPDRPDVLSVFETRIEAPKRFGTLLANGNLIDQGDLKDDRHYAIWRDPTKKPSYLFACVIADLARLSDGFVTMEGRKVLLEIYADAADIDKCHVAMQALKDAMRWDEQNYGRAYDLDRYMIVATGKFNMGAMENKGLNIFNTACALSDPATTTDAANLRVKSVIAHEYFHNWTGNRITCRDWFQLCLKEGLTVYRDQSFSADLGSQAAARIDDVGVLRAAQFSEDAGALAHPARPDSFVTINNFYTATVYEKGAEIVRTMANWLGKEKYRAGMDVYFARHDGQAVTVEDFVAALASQDDGVYDFLRWYTQPGTPVLSGQYSHDDTGVRIELAQSVRHVDGYAPPLPLPIVVDVAVFDRQTGALLAEQKLLLKDWRQTFAVQVNLQNKTPLLSVLRGFSSPVLLDFAYSDDELADLARFESDGFNRWQALQLLVERYLTLKMDEAPLIAETLKGAVLAVWEDDPMLAARLFDVPSQKELAAQVDKNCDPLAIKNRRDALKRALATALRDRLGAWYAALEFEAYEDTPKAVGKRALRNAILELLAWVDQKDAAAKAALQYQKASCMSERFGALQTLCAFDLPNKQTHLRQFYERFAKEELVVDMWFSVQALSESADAEAIAALMRHPRFDWQTPNRVRSVLSAVAARPVLLWSDEGLGLYTDAVAKLDGQNPQLAARFLGALGRWYTLTPERKKAAGDAIAQLAGRAKSKDVLELCAQLLDAKRDG